MGGGAPGRIRGQPRKMLADGIKLHYRRSSICTIVRLDRMARFSWQQLTRFVRGIGAPNAVNISSSPRGERVAVINFSQGPRAGIYTFTGGRLSSVERGAEPLAAPKPDKPKKKKPAQPAPT